MSRGCHIRRGVLDSALGGRFSENLQKPVKTTPIMFANERGWCCDMAAGHLQLCDAGGDGHSLLLFTLFTYIVVFCSVHLASSK